MDPRDQPSKSSRIEREMAAQIVLRCGDSWDQSLVATCLRSAEIRNDRLFISDESVKLNPAAGRMVEFHHEVWRRNNDAFGWFAFVPGALKP